MADFTRKRFLSLGTCLFVLSLATGVEACWVACTNTSCIALNPYEEGCGTGVCAGALCNCECREADDRVTCTCDP